MVGCCTIKDRFLKWYIYVYHTSSEAEFHIQGTNKAAWAFWIIFYAEAEKYVKKLLFSHTVVPGPVYKGKNTTLIQFTGIVTIYNYHQFYH